MSSVPPGWTIERFGDHIEFAQNGFSRRETVSEFGPIVLRIANITGGRISLHEISQYEMTDEELSTYRLKPGDLLFVRVNGSAQYIGRCALVGNWSVPMAFDENIIRLRAAKTYSPKFLYYLLSSPLVRSRLLAEINWSTGGQFTISQPILKSLKLPLPPLPEQRKIAAILSTWDEAIGTVEALIAALKRRKQGLMQRLLTGEVRFPGFTEPWREVRLGEALAQVQRPTRTSTDGSYRLIGVRWYVAGVHIHDTRDGGDIVTASLSQVRTDDITYNKMWVSKAAFGVVPQEYDGAFCTSEYPLFRAESDYLVTDYMGYLFFDRKFQKVATDLCRGTTGRVRLDPADFLRIEVLLPRPDEQVMITNLLKSVDETIQGREVYLSRLREQKRGLMQRLLTGDVRVKV
ncbi:MAG: restriction endonuclease subunit S [Chloroflexi bacterium]|nr:restriction endonuclease subunit S [Chloroflexota bacterium]